MYYNILFSLRATKCDGKGTERCRKKSGDLHVQFKRKRESLKRTYRPFVNFASKIKLSRKALMLSIPLYSRSKRGKYKQNTHRVTNWCIPECKSMQMLLNECFFFFLYLLFWYTFVLHVSTVFSFVSSDCLKRFCHSWRVSAKSCDKKKKKKLFTWSINIVQKE